MASMRDSSGNEKDSPERTDQLKFTNRYEFMDKLWLHNYSAQLENMIRKAVREEVEHAIQRSSLSNSSSLPSQIDASQSRPYKLQFEGKLPSTLFTGNKLEAEGLSPVTIQLVDAVSGHRITDGPLASKKVEIVVLHGHFKSEQLEEWTKKEFCSHMVSERYNKRPLLVGERIITLQNGIGSVGDVYFTDNSSWGRTKMFRLGARVVLAPEDQVREAVSSPFQVKDRRGETYKKHNVPSLEDEVWRLCGISKDGKICRRLKERQIYKVEDFVRQYHNDESLLRQIVKVSPKKWKAIVKQATTCYSDQPSSNLSNLAQNNIPIDSTINPNTIPCFDMQQHSHYVPPSFQAEQAEMSEFHPGEHSHQLNQSTALDESLLEDLTLDYCSMPSSSVTRFSDSHTSPWFPAQSAGEDSECIFMNSSMSSTPGAGVNAPVNPDSETG